MWPTLLSFGPIAIHSFGVLVFLGIFWGGFVWWQKGREENFNEEELMDVFLASVVTSFLIGRVWYILANWSFFVNSFYKMIFFTKFPGMAYEGVVVGGVLGLVVFSLKKGFEVWKVFDLSVFSLLWIEILTHFGSFLAGSQVGKETNWFIGVPFPGVEGRRWPIQLILAVALMGLYKLLSTWEKEYRSFDWYAGLKGESKPGFLVASYLIGVGLIHFVLGWFLEHNHWQFALSLAGGGGLILLLRSGISLKWPVKKPLEDKTESSVQSKMNKRFVNKRKKKGFDFK